MNLSQQLLTWKKPKRTPTINIFHEIWYYTPDVFCDLLIQKSYNLNRIFATDNIDTQINLFTERLNKCLGLVQWSAFGHDNLGSRDRSPDIRWPLFIIWYNRRMAKDYPNCYHTVLKWDLQCLYASEALTAIRLSSSQHIRENVNIQGVTIKHLEPYAK